MKVVFEQIVKIIERVIKKLIRQQVKMNGIQFGFIQGCVTVTTCHF